MAEDTVELLRQIGVSHADIFGHSMGGEIALDIGIRHPDRVRKLVLVGAGFDYAGFQPGVLDAIARLRPEDLVGSRWHEEYLRIAPRPQDFPVLVEKVKNRRTVNQSPAAIRAMRAPTLLVFGDSDLYLPGHEVEMFRLFGGGVSGDHVGLPTAQLAVLPGTSHTMVADRADLLLPIIPAFLDCPMPATTGK